MDVTLSTKLVDYLHVAPNRRSQIVLVQIEDLNGNANEEWSLSLIGTKMVAKFYDSAYYTPGTGEWIGSSESYMEYLAENEATAYERLRSLYDKCVPTFWGKYRSENSRRVPVVLLQYISGLPLTQPSLSSEIIHRLKEQVMQNLKEIHSYGVSHNDIRGDNILWDGQDRVIFVDFEHAKDGRKHLLARDDSFLSSVFDD